MNANVDHNCCQFLLDFGMKVGWKKLATICRNYEINLLEIPFEKLKIIVKNYQEQSLHQLELKFLPVISTNFDGKF